MSCYFRHMKDVLDEAGIEVTAENKKEVDRALHRAAGVEYKDCSAAWKKIKEGVRSDEKARRAFVRRVKKEIGA